MELLDEERHFDEHDAERRTLAGLERWTNGRRPT
jgi:hypothetical protein